MTVTLTGVEACGYTAVDDISDGDVQSAAWLIRLNTSYTPDEHNTLRNVPADPIRRAWAIVAARVKQNSAAVGDEGIVSETQGDYSYTVELGDRERFRADPLHGMPRELLGLSSASWASVRPGQTVWGTRDGVYWDLT